MPATVMGSRGFGKGVLQLPYTGKHPTYESWPALGASLGVQCGVVKDLEVEEGLH
jgi:hypothetical protein